MIKGTHSYTIRDAMPGVEYFIQLRTREEYDGHWSDWSTPVYESSWTGKQTHTSTRRNKSIESNHFKMRSSH